jgi:hypothetical protein
MDHQPFLTPRIDIAMKANTVHTPIVVPPHLNTPANTTNIIPTAKESAVAQLMLCGIGVFLSLKRIRTARVGRISRMPYKKCLCEIGHPDTLAHTSIIPTANRGAVSQLTVSGVGISLSLK